LEDCGRVCISSSFIKRVKQAWERSDDLDSFLVNGGEVWGHIERGGDGIYVEYGECYCPLVKGYPEKISSSWCNCSRGWLLELFERALERPVKIELEKSIKQGDDVCRFRILL
jgi:predicted hydrocarbon binding protein